MKTENTNGSEIHRLKPMKEGYDQELFLKLYKISGPVIKRLSKQVDPKRFDVSPDIIESYFWDKMLYIFNKYYGECTEDHLRARILAGLATFKNHLLHSAYTERAEFNQSLHSFEDLFENSKEDEESEYDYGEEETSVTKSDMISKVWDYMKEHLSPDALLVFEVLYTPPPFIREYEGYKDGNRITNKMLIEFFEMPMNNKSEQYIRELRNDVSYWIERAGKELTI